MPKWPDSIGHLSGGRDWPNDTVHVKKKWGLCVLWIPIKEDVFLNLDFFEWLGYEETSTYVYSKLGNFSKIQEESVHGRIKKLLNTLCLLSISHQLSQLQKLKRETKATAVLTLEVSFIYVFLFVWVASKFLLFQETMSQKLCHPSWLLPFHQRYLFTLCVCVTIY